MKSFNKLLDRFFPSKCNIPDAESNKDNKGVLKNRVYSFEGTKFVNLIEDNDNPTEKHIIDTHGDLPTDISKSIFSSQHEKKSGERKEETVKVNDLERRMSRANFQLPMTPKPTSNYGDGCRPTERVEESFPVLDNRKRRITDVPEPFQLVRGKRRKLFEPPITPISQPSFTSLKSQSTDYPQDKLSLQSSLRLHSLDNLRKSYNASKTPESIRESSSSQSHKNRNIRISSDGQIQKLSRAPERSRDRLALILEVHVFVHIRKALKPYHGHLSKRDCKEIGEDAVRTIIDHPDFKNHFKSNSNCILPDYEPILAAQACSYVNGRARHILGDDIVNKLLYSTQINICAIKSLQSNLRCQSSTSISDSASEQEEIFCLQTEKSARLNSFSPSTSLSTDQTDIETVKKPTDSPSHVTIPLRRTTRLTKVLNPVCAKSITRGTIRPQDPYQLFTSNDRGRLKVGKVNSPRPYLRYQDRKKLLKLEKDEIKEEPLLHVPFSGVEMNHILTLLKKQITISIPVSNNFIQAITGVMAGRIYLVGKIADSIGFKEDSTAIAKALSGRTRTDIIAFLLDTVNNTVSEYETTKSIESLEREKIKTRFNPVNRLLRHREIDGIYPARIRRGQTSYREVVSSFLEDCLVRQSEWADCSNDIAAISWISNDAFIVGALTHSDPHNMQYNKPGNLLVGSVSQDTLKSYPHHKIERPIVSEFQNLENSLDSMRATQSPWLYTSVVSSAHSDVSGYTFTSSYDKSVKVWKVYSDGSGMCLCATWTHDARVNFVVTSEHHDRVATASGTNHNAVRVYHFYEHAIEESPYDEYGGNKSQEQSGDIYEQRPWAYQPATIKWARSSCIENLLLVGYSPRADSGDDSDIPDDKKNTGELCIWDSDDGTRLHVSSGRMHNVFDAVWHPTQPVFAVATSPFGNYDSDRTKTQVRIFALNEYTFISIMTLDCPALDITELTLMPNSAIKLYVTASCTDSCTYVWDVALGEDPIHILRHGESIDNPEPNLPLELADDGVTFSAWGADVSRFYTGATDGKLIAWDIRKSPGNAFVKNVLELSGGISCGAFAKDFQRLLIGDSTGRIHLLGIDDSDLSEDERLISNSIKAKNISRKPGSLSSSVRPPKIVIPHPEPLPPNFHETSMKKSSCEKSCEELLCEGVLQIYPGKGVFQGPKYHSSLLYRAEAHEYGDIQRPLKPEILSNQQFLKEDNIKSVPIPTLPRVRRSRIAADHKAHGKNTKLDFDLSKLTLKTRQELKRDRAEIDWNEAHTFEYELSPLSTIFSKEDSSREISTEGGLSRRYSTT
ncbi:hypothetical protein EPUL_003322 [Erysiphe pulchra]|uniref:Uncharacterized protein n=1 Tax=Erysiphe pulchra TaxID=225359 RepID=A0A2S4PQ96_9PEZI|nr:hypothetical protein EPUL_003322 [Erysiphe pulchra]